MKLFFGWSNIKKFLLQIVETFSADKSKLSAKRLTTFVANCSAIALTWIFVCYMLIYKELTAVDFAIAIAPIVGIGAYALTRSEMAKDAKPKEEPKLD